MTTGRPFQIEADGVNVHAVEWTARGASRQVVLVHGLGANTLTWEPAAQLLADRLDATVTAVDLVGFGRTRAPERRATLTTNEQLVSAILERSGPAIVLGNSMGGAIGIRVTARRPELVEQLVLVNPAVPHVRADIGAWLRLARRAPALVPALGGMYIGTRARIIGPARLVDTNLAWSVHDTAKIDPDLRDRLVALAAERYGYAEAPAAYADAARSLLLYLARGIIRDLGVAASARPVLLAHGEHDRLVPLAAAEAAARSHPAVDLEVLRGVGHAPQLEEPELLVAAISRWLDAERPAPVEGVGGVRS